MNIPYVKEYKNGTVSNPITYMYVARYPNRKQRRAHLQKKPLFGDKVQAVLFNGKFIKTIRHKA